MFGYTMKKINRNLVIYFIFLSLCWKLKPSKITPFFFSLIWFSFWQKNLPVKKTTGAMDSWWLAFRRSCSLRNLESYVVEVIDGGIIIVKCQSLMNWQNFGAKVSCTLQPNLLVTQNLGTNSVKSMWEQFTT